MLHRRAQEKSHVVQVQARFSDYKLALPYLFGVVLFDKIEGVRGGRRRININLARSAQNYYTFVILLIYSLFILRKLKTST